MASLHWIFIQQNHMAAVELIHFKGLFPGQKRVGLGSTAA
jgi:hypothetical protein